MRTNKWKKYSQSRARRESKSRKHWQKFRRHRNRQVNGQPTSSVAYAQRGVSIRTEILRPPAHFSLIENYEVTNKFFQELIRHLQRGDRERGLYVEMANVDRITIETILVLVAMIKRRKRRGIQVSGNSPTSADASKLLLLSGFYEHFHSRIGPSNDGNCTGTIVKRKGLRVNPDLANKLVQDAQEATCGVRGYIPPAYRILIEAMGNTREHAKPGKRSKSKATRNVEPWWVMLYCDKENKIARFVFYDAGIGVIQSLRPKIASFLSRLHVTPQDTDLVHDMMHGRSMSRTGLTFRGKGLPAMAGTLAHGRVHGLTMITNSVFADVANGRYTHLSSSFQGTLICWEIK